MKLVKWLNGLMSVVVIVIFTALGSEILFNLYEDFGVGINMPVCRVLAGLAVTVIFITWTAVVAKKPSNFLLMVKSHLWSIVGWTAFYVLLPVILRAVNLQDGRWGYLMATPIALMVYLVLKVLHPGNVEPPIHHGRLNTRDWIPESTNPDRITVIPKNERTLGLEMLEEDASGNHWRQIDKLEGIGRDRV